MALTSMRLVWAAILSMLVSCVLFYFFLEGRMCTIDPDISVGIIFGILGISFILMTTAAVKCISKKKKIVVQILKPEKV